MAGPDDVDRAVKAARAALSGAWGKTAATELSRLLHALADAMQAIRKDLAELEARNVGKAISSVKAELAQGIENFRAQEEIFGPVVSLIAFDDEKDAIRIANDTKYGLFATVWTGDPARGHRLAARIKAGEIGINMPYTAFPGIPFGDYKQSGFGRELGLERSTCISRRRACWCPRRRSRSTHSGCNETSGRPTS
jgi:acyl-CoA reductase-like NAD-dependent aldehyde dehydrogenase